MAGRVCGVGGDWEAKCFREKRARKRWASGVVSVQRVLRRVRIVASVICGMLVGLSSIRKGAILIWRVYGRLL